MTNTGFHDVDYHSGEPFDGTDWPVTVGATSVTWATQTYAQNQNANALRWGTLYNFRFDANVAPATSSVVIGLFRPGTPTSISVSTVTPGPCSAVEGACGNGVDDDCDTRPDCIDVDCCTSPSCSGSDADGDHFAAVCDCNDANATVFPGAPQICDGINNDCSAPGWPAVPANEADADGDGVRLCGGDCDDTNPQRYPGHPEACDGIDNDCAGGVPANEADVDGDGVRTCGGDCDDADPRRYPGNLEVCDGIDNDCDFIVPAVEVDADGDGVLDCQNDCDSGNVSVWATPGEVRDLMLTQAGGVTTLTWSPPLNTGCASPRYDTLRSRVADDFVVVAECVESDGTDTVSFDPDDTDADLHFYLVRCENDCPSPLGEGLLGTDSSSAPRPGRLCP